MRALRHSILIAAAALSLIFMPAAAQAQTASLTCDTSSGKVDSGQLYNVQPNAGACEFSGLQHVFSTVVCNFVSILNNIMSTLYCGIQFSITFLLTAIITLYILFFGMQLLMGTTPLNSREIVTRLLKIALVWTFSTQSAWGIGFVFRAFIGSIGDMSGWVLKMVDPQIGVTGSDVMPLYNYLDGVIYSAITGPFTAANSKIIGFFQAYTIAEPPMLLIAVYWLWTTFKIMVNALISFLLGVSALAFLIALSPIFLSMMLFKMTYHFFESWIRYMISFSLQIVVVFAVIAMWLTVMTKFTGFFNDLSNIIWVYQKVWVQSSNTYAPTDTFAVCPPIISAGPVGPTAQCSSGFNPNTSNADKNALVPPSDIMTLVNGSTGQDFLYYISYNLGSLVLIAYAFSMLLTQAPQIAKELVGPAQVPVMGGGWGGMGLGRPGGGGGGGGGASTPFGWERNQRQQRLSSSLYSQNSGSASIVERYSQQIQDRNQNNPE